MNNLIEDGMDLDGSHLTCACKGVKFGPVHVKIVAGQVIPMVCWEMNVCNAVKVIKCLQEGYKDESVKRFRAIATPREN